MSTSAVIDFVTDAGRLEYTREEIAAELHTLGRYVPDEPGKRGWPRASAAEWIAEIDRLLVAGSLIRTESGSIRIAPKPVEMRQQSLF
jgi:hypothetical protein